MYEKKISRALAGLIVFLLDDSGSMRDKLSGTSDPKFLWVIRYIQIILKELLARSTELKGDEVVVKPRYYVYVVVYGSTPDVWGNGQMDIGTAVERFTANGKDLGLGGLRGGTDAKKAMQCALQYLKAAVADKRFCDSFPPMLFHLTDGMSGSDATPEAQEIMNLATADGNVLMVNGFIGTQTNLSYEGSEDFPGYVDVTEVGPNEDNIRLFNMSSIAPPSLRQNLIDDGVFPRFRDGARLFFDVRSKESLKNVIQVIGSLGSRADRLER